MHAHTSAPPHAAHLRFAASSSRCALALLLSLALAAGCKPSTLRCDVLGCSVGAGAVSAEGLVGGGTAGDAGSVEGRAGLFG
eukprot:11961-Pelagomonas_calceolata.AAC.3